VLLFVKLKYTLLRTIEAHQSASPFRSAGAVQVNVHLWRFVANNSVTGTRPLRPVFSPGEIVVPELAQPLGTLTAYPSRMTQYSS